MKRVRRSIVALLLSGCGSTADSEVVAGTVLDTAGDPVVGAQVEVVGVWGGGCDGGHCDSYVTVCTTTDSSGTYEAVLEVERRWFEDLQPLTVSVRAGKAGFQQESCSPDECRLDPCSEAREPDQCDELSQQWSCEPGQVDSQ